ncbi:MAG: helix-turn-helix transcriptional regulator [Lysobacter sp.]|nr:helix-turn-helix transcriptional regulator [Lysobacter sp.]
MPTLDNRIRRARTLAGLTQAELAQLVGVQRGAVAQWESPNGSLPSMDHLIAIAQHTGVHLEWLGTGRGKPCPEAGQASPDTDERAQDELEAACLQALRRMPRRMRERILSVLQAVAR